VRRLFGNMRSTSRSLRRPLVLASVLATASCAAESVSLAADAASVGQARFEEGTAALDKGDFEGARLSLLQAYAIDPQPRYLWKLAVAEEMGDHPLDALSHARQYARAPGLSDDERQAAAGLVAKASVKVGHVRLEAPPSTTFSLDGAPLTIVAPVADPLDVAPGKHALEAHFHERTASTAVAPAAGETVVWQIQFEAPAPAARPAAPAATPKPVEPTYETPSGKPPATARWIAAAGFVAGSLASLGVMGGFLAAARNEDEKWSLLDATTGSCPQPPATAQCSALKAAADARATDENIAIGFGTAGGVFVVAAVVSLLAWPDTRPKAAGAIVPMVDARAAGVQWVGSF
jgi:hypothetical protein